MNMNSETYLNEQKEAYQWDYRYENMGFPKKLHLKDAYSMEVMGKVVKAKSDIFINKLESKSEQFIKDEADKWKHKLNELFSGPASQMGEQWSKALGWLSVKDHRHDVDQLKEYSEIYDHIPLPKVMEDHLQDWHFAWQRLAGPTPMLLKCWKSLPEKFPLTAQRFHDITGEDLNMALQEGRVFVNDFEMLKGVQGVEKRGFKKYNYAPIALFLSRPQESDPKKSFLPVAIQCQQEPDHENPIFTPQDGLKWRMAKVTVQVADANIHGVCEHLPTHMFMCGVTLSFKRNIAKDHPLFPLLEAHTQWTLAVAEITKKIVVNPDGEQDMVNPGPLKETLGLYHRAEKDFILNQSGVPEFFKRRGTQDKNSLPSYPFRDDAEKIWAALQTFISTYMNKCYTSDQAVADDQQLQAFISELGSHEGARIHGLGREGKVLTLGVLQQTLTEILWRATGYHASINYSGFEHMSLGSNAAYSGYGPAPTASKEVTEADWLKMMPPMEVAYEQLGILYTQSMLNENRFGHYPRFEQPELEAAAEEFRKNLSDIEKSIQSENQKRPFAYELLLPSMIPNSIQV
jgi:arachidonate 15-lipoxygenase